VDPSRRWAPPDDPGFANVGRSSNSLTGVYIGNRWVLTAYHVGEPATFRYVGVNYPTVPGSQVRFETSPGVGADLAVVRLASEPPLPPLVLATTGPAVTDVVTLIGHGRLRETALTCWNGAFSEVSCGMGPPPVFEGYKTSSQRTIRWGMNAVTAIDSQQTIPNSGTSMGFETVFDESDGVTHEAQLVPGDSGGGAFLKRGSQWELVGILFAQGIAGGQPGDTAVFGNESWMVGVAFYEAQIDAVLNPPLLVPLAPFPAVALVGASLAAIARRSLRRRHVG
jgi:hypothetical protein